MLSDDDRKKAAAQLIEAEKTRTQMVQLSETWPDITIEDAYAIQSEVTAQKVAGGARRNLEAFTGPLRDATYVLPDSLFLLGPTRDRQDLVEVLPYGLGLEIGYEAHQFLREGHSRVAQWSRGDRLDRSAGPLRDSNAAARILRIALPQATRR